MMRTLAVAVMLSVAATAVAQPTPSQIKLSPCRLEHPFRMLALTAECGSFVTPENPAEPDGLSSTIRGAFPAISFNKNPTAVPDRRRSCTSARDLYTSSSGPFDRIRRERDIPARSARYGRSHDSIATGHENLFDRVEDIRIEAENAKCRDQLAKHSDLRQYTTSIAVRDLDNVRRALGYQRINLFGNSYGTRVAQHYARRYPQATRALILDGVVNPEVVLGPAIALDAESALRRILARCMADKACAKAFTDPAADYRALREQLSDKPQPTMVSDAATGKPINFDFTTRHLSAVLRFASYNDDQAALPAIAAHGGGQGNFTPRPAIPCVRALARSFVRLWHA